MSKDELCQLLEQKCGRHGGRNYRCPAHEDATPSLAVSQAPDGKILMYCFNGCSVRDICSALGIKLRDLFPRK